VKTLVRKTLALASLEVDEVGIHCVSPATISKLHQDYFNDPTLTDCISFPSALSGPVRTLGDVFVCPAVAVQKATAHGWDIQLELSLYIVHGLLHLMGYDDIKPADRREMRKQEKRYLAHLKPLELELLLV